MKERSNGKEASGSDSRERRNQWKQQVGGKVFIPSAFLFLYVMVFSLRVFPFSDDEPPADPDHRAALAHRGAQGERRTQVLAGVRVDRARPAVHLGQLQHGGQQTQKQVSAGKKKVTIQECESVRMRRQAASSYRHVFRVALLDGQLTQLI